MALPIRKVSVGCFFQAVILVAFLWLAAKSAHAQALEYCYMSSSDAQVSCHESLHGAEQAMRNDSVYRDLLHPADPVPVGSSPHLVGLKLPYIVDDQPPTNWYEESYNISGWIHGSVPGLCEPTNSPVTSNFYNWCGPPEEAMLDNFYTYHTNGYGNCAVSDYTMTTEFTLFTRVSSAYGRPYVDYNPRRIQL